MPRRMLSSGSLPWPVLLIGGISLSWLTPSSALGGFALPSYVHTLDELEDAKEMARDYEQPVAFVYTDKGTT